MKILKRVLLALAVIIALPLIIALFTTKDYGVEREVEINQPLEVVFDYVKFLKNQDNFSKWAMTDPNMKKTYVGTDGMPGFVSKWESENPDVGAGEQEIKNVTNNDRIDYELRFLKPMESTEKAYMTTESVDAGTTLVKWGFNGSMKYPSNIMLLFMNFDKMIGGDFETGLQRLKEILETPVSEPEQTVEETQTGEEVQN